MVSTSTTVNIIPMNLTVHSRSQTENPPRSCSIHWPYWESHLSCVQCNATKLSNGPWLHLLPGKLWLWSDLVTFTNITDHYQALYLVAFVQNGHSPRISTLESSKVNGYLNKLFLWFCFFQTYTGSKPVISGHISIWGNSSGLHGTWRIWTMRFTSMPTKRASSAIAIDNVLLTSGKNFGY